jgi:oxygen-dependent protoporphyrinogen oxidase
VSADVIIIGGGIAGLSAAYELTRRGVPFVLLESRARAGGVVLSERIDGFTIDAGPDSLLIQKPEGIRLCEELGLGDRLVVTRTPRLAYIQRGGRLYPLPSSSVLGIPTRVGPFIRTPLFSWRGKLRMGAEVFVPPRRDDGDESIGAFMRRRFGIEATEYLAEPLLAGIHSGDVDRLSINSLFPRFVQSERKHGSLIRAFRAETTPHVSVDGAFKSLPGGLSEMICALVGKLPAQSVRLNVPVARIGSDGPPDGATPPPRGGFRIETASGEIFAAAVAIVATPAFAAARLLAPLDPELAALCDQVPYASTATVILAFDRGSVRHPLNGSGFVVPRREASGILAGSWMSSKWPQRAPADRVLLRTFVGGARDPQALERSDAELIALSLGALRPLLGITGVPLLARVYRWDRGNAQHEVGHLARMAAIERAVARHPGLLVTGSGFRGVGIPDCVADGRRIGAQAAGLHSESRLP